MRYGEPWFECHICGLDFPVSQGMRHYKSRKLVDQRCFDEPTHSDYLEQMLHPGEDSDDQTEQPVSDQGEVE